MLAGVPDTPLARTNNRSIVFYSLKRILEQKDHRSSNLVSFFNTAVIKNFPRFLRETPIIVPSQYHCISTICNVSEKELHYKCFRRNIKQDLSEQIYFRILLGDCFWLHDTYNIQSFKNSLFTTRLFIPSSFKKQCQDTY